jgi:hypothetical protein
VEEVVIATVRGERDQQQQGASDQHWPALAIRQPRERTQDRSRRRCGRWWESTTNTWLCEEWSGTGWGTAHSQQERQPAERIGAHEAIDVLDRWEPHELQPADRSAPLLPLGSSGQRAANTFTLQRELDAGRRPEQIKQIEFSGEPLDLASVLRWRRKILADQVPFS